MIRPNYLKQGDSIAIISSARKISEEEVKPAIHLFESWGLKVQTGPNLFGEHHQFSGTDAQRLTDLQWAIDAPEIKAVVFARGGYGTARLLDELNFDTLLKAPKWFVGYSDLTALHLHLYSQLKLESLHATMPVNISFSPSADEIKSNNSLRDALFGTERSLPLADHKFNRIGDAKGVLVGGNLSIIYSLLGSVSIPADQGIVLFLEDLDEYLYHIDRMMVNLRRNQLFERVNAVLIGGMSDMNDNTIPFGKTAEEIIHDTLVPYSFPVYFGLPFGHIQPNIALPHGKNVRIINNKLFL